MEPPTSNLVNCEVCNIQCQQNNYDSHINGKKHLTKLEQYNKVHKSIFVLGAVRLTPADLERIFSKFGEVSHVVKRNNFVSVQFTEKSAVENALKSRIYSGGQKLTVRRYEDKSARATSNNESPNKDKSRKLSETSSQSELSTGQVGLAELPLVLPDPAECPDTDNVFDWQVHHFISQVELPAVMYQRLTDVMSDVKQLFSPVLPGCTVIVFGSCGSTLALRNSDVDLYLECAGEQPTDFVRREVRLMYRSRLVQILARVPTARVPIVRFMHLKTGWQCDLTANSPLGVCNSRLIRFLISLDPRIRPLIMLVKYWAKVCMVTGSHQQMTTYSLVMVVIFYLQQLTPPILPPVAVLMQLADHQEVCLGWACGFCDDESKLRSAHPMEVNNMSLKDLFTRFFQFYHSFDYNNVMCPLLGRTVPVSDFSTPENLPEEMKLYKERLTDEPKLEFRRSVMVKTQDPFELGLNITRNVTDRSFLMFRKACEVSCAVCEKSDESSLLRNIFMISKESLEIEEDSFTFKIQLQKDAIENTSSFTENGLMEWYELTKEAILLVLREVMKFTVEAKNLEMLSKVKKLESSQDVHTLPNSSSGSDDLVYTCSGNSDVCKSRKKTSKLLNVMKISLSAFEKEVCISNSLYQPNQNKSVSCKILISSFEKFKIIGKSLELKIFNSPSSDNSQFKEIVYFFKFNLRVLVLQAAVFIKQMRASDTSSSITEVKDSLKELFDIKLATLPDLTNLKNHTVEEECPPLSEKKKKSKLFRQQNDLLLGIEKNKSNDKTNYSNCASTSQVTDVISVSEKGSSGKAGCETTEMGYSNNVEDQVMRTVHSPAKITHTTKPQVVHSDELNTVTVPDEGNPEKCLGGSKLSDNFVGFKNMLDHNEVKETQSSVPGKKTNPFLASIERVSSDSNEKTIDTTQTNMEVKNENPRDTSDPDAMSQEEEPIESNRCPNSTNDNVSKEGNRSGFNPIQQRPKVFVERPHKYRKPFNYKPSQSNVYKQQYDEPHAYKERGAGPYEQQRQIVGVSSTSEYRDKYPSIRGGFSRSDKNQRQIAMSIEKQKLWYPTLFKQNK